MNVMPKRPRDTNQLAKMVVDIATGQIEGRPPEPAGRAIGGHARPRNQSGELAAKANAARWSGEAKSELSGHQGALDFRPDQPIRVSFGHIFDEGATEAKKGQWFEHLFTAAAKDVSDFQIAHVPARQGQRPHGLCGWRT